MAVPLSTSTVKHAATCLDAQVRCLASVHGFAPVGGAIVIGLLKS
jgi:hypothetical protein